MKNKPLLIFITFVLLISYRYSIIKTEEKYIILSMAIINMVAFGVLLFSISNNLFNEFSKKIDESNLTSRDKQQCKHNLNIPIVLILIIYGVLAFIYIKYWAASSSNDIVSIITLGLSIEADESFCIWLADKIYTKI